MGKRNAGPCLRPRCHRSYPKGLSWVESGLLGRQDHPCPEVPFTCNGCIRPRLLLPPGWYKYCDVCVAPLQKPVYSQQDASAGEDLLVPMAGGERRVGVSPRGWLTCCPLEPSRREVPLQPLPWLRPPPSGWGPRLTFPPGSHSAWDGQTWGFPSYSISRQ